MKRGARRKLGPPRTSMNACFSRMFRESISAESGRARSLYASVPRALRTMRPLRPVQQAQRAGGGLGKAAARLQGR